MELSGSQKAYGSMVKMREVIEMDEEEHLRYETRRSFQNLCKKQDAENRIHKEDAENR